MIRWVFGVLISGAVIFVWFDGDLSGRPATLAVLAWVALWQGLALILYMVGSSRHYRDGKAEDRC